MSKKEAGALYNVGNFRPYRAWVITTVLPVGETRIFARASYRNLLHLIYYIFISINNFGKYFLLKSNSLKEFDLGVNQKKFIKVQVKITIN